MTSKIRATSWSGNVSSSKKRPQPLYFHRKDPHNSQNVISRIMENISCPLCHTHEFKEFSNREEFWSHLHKHRTRYDFLAVENKEGIHIAAKNKQNSTPTIVKKPPTVTRPPSESSFCTPILEAANQRPPPRLEATSQRWPSLKETIASTPLPKRIDYRRSDNFELITTAEWMLDINPQDSIDNDWKIRLSREYLNEFNDVTDSEKSFMILWNDFILEKRSCQAVSRSDIPGLVKAFIETHSMKLPHRDLARFLANLRMQDLIHRDHILESMRFYYECTMPDEQKN